MRPPGPRSFTPRAVQNLFADHRRAVRRVFVERLVAARSSQSRLARFG